MSKVLAIFRRGHPSVNPLSEHIDARLDPASAVALELHLASCASCAQRFEELRASRGTLRSLPQLDAPRSFRLRPADVRAPAIERRRPAGSGALRLMPAMSAVAVVLFVVLVGFEAIWRADDRGPTAGPVRQAFTAARTAPADALKSEVQANAGAAATTSPQAPAAAAPVQTGNDCAECDSLSQRNPPATTPSVTQPNLEFGTAADNSPRPGTSGAAPTSVTPTAAANDMTGVQPQATAATESYQPQPADVTRRNNDRLVLHVAEAVSAAIGAAAAAISGVVWWRRRGAWT